MSLTPTPALDAPANVDPPAGVTLTARPVVGGEGVLTGASLTFVAALVRAFGPRVAGLLAERERRQAAYDAGERPGFDPATADLRNAPWRVAELPARLLTRRVEITGPVDRKTVINALNSGADVFMADFEDATSPTWPNLIAGQRNLIDAVRGEIRYEAPGAGRVYTLGERRATLMVRPRGWHLPEKHVLVDGARAPGALVDFGLFFFHNARPLAAGGEGPYVYLPKLEAPGEARLWADVFAFAEGALGLAKSTTRATVLIETLPAAFCMNEILYELRDYAAALNCGRWDYIFSYIKTLRGDPARALPDRGRVTMSEPFLRDYARLLVHTCHRRGALAMGGMAAQIPIKSDPAANDAALAAVRADKLREARAGYDGTWVAHPALVPIARDVFDAEAPGHNQLDRALAPAHVSATDLLRAPAGPRTEQGLRANVRVGVRYLASWLGGVGCVPIANLMEDAATAEIARAQVWQWLRHGAEVEGAPLDGPRVAAVIAQEAEALAREVGGPYLDEATALFSELSTAHDCAPFLTLPAYERLAD